MGKHLEQALPSVYTLQCLTGKVDNNNNITLSTKSRDVVPVVPTVPFAVFCSNL